MNAIIVATPCDHDAGNSLIGHLANRIIFGDHGLLMVFDLNQDVLFLMFG